MRLGQFVPLVVTVLVVGLVGVILWVQHVREQRRQAAYQAFANERGYGYVAKRPGGERPYAAVVKIFTRGMQHRWRDELSGQYGGVPFTAFEYRYTISSGRSSRTYTFAMIHWQTPDRALPQFALAPEGFFQRVGQLFGAQDIDFPEDPAFSRGYVLKGADENAVRALFTESIRRALSANLSNNAAGAGADLFWWRETALPPPAEIDALLASGDWFRRLLLAG